MAVNNAGVVNGGYSWEIPLEDWHRVIDVDLWGVIHGIRSFVPRILASGEEGHVVNTAPWQPSSPWAGSGPTPSPSTACSGSPTSCAPSWRRSEAPVGVSVVMPGMIKTGMNPDRHRVHRPWWRPTWSTPSADGRSYVFTDDHSTSEVEDRLRAILAARGDVIG